LLPPSGSELLVMKKPYNQSLQATAVKRLGWQVERQRSAVPELIRSAEYAP
jgi:hypothetical protein